MSAELKTEYERLQAMHHQMHLLEKNGKRLKSKWQRAKQLIKSTISTLPESEVALKEALLLSSTALLAKQVEDDNPPLKKIALDSMDGCPVWVVSYNNDGRWGIVDSKNQAVLFLTSEGIEEDYWFDGRYIFAYRKEIRDYSRLLEKHGIVDEG